MNFPGKNTIALSQIRKGDIFHLRVFDVMFFLQGVFNLKGGNKHEF